jgi:hypothetical protein
VPLPSGMPDAAVSEIFFLTGSLRRRRPRGGLLAEWLAARRHAHAGLNRPTSRRSTARMLTSWRRHERSRDRPATLIGSVSVHLPCSRRRGSAPASIGPCHGAGGDGAAAITCPARATEQWRHAEHAVPTTA